MAYDDAFALLGLDNRSDHIAEFEAHLGVGVVFPSDGDDMIVESTCLGGGRCQRYEAISPVDVQIDPYRSDPMRGVKVPVSMYAVQGAPLCFRNRIVAKLDSAPVDLLAIVEFHLAEIVLVATFKVDELSEDVFAHHLKDGHHVAPITDVFEDHTRHSGGLVGLYQIPALFYGVGRRDFDARILPSFHRVDRHAGVPEPRC